MNGAKSAWTVGLQAKRRTTHMSRMAWWLWPYPITHYSFWSIGVWLRHPQIDDLERNLPRVLSHDLFFERCCQWITTGKRWRWNVQRLYRLFSSALTRQHDDDYQAVAVDPTRLENSRPTQFPSSRHTCIITCSTRREAERSGLVFSPRLRLVLGPSSDLHWRN